MDVFRDRLRRLAVSAAAALVIGLLAIASLACAAASLWIYAIPHLGPAGAPLAVAGLFVGLGIAALVVTRYGMARRRVAASSQAATAAALADALRLIGDHPEITLMTAFLAGVTAGIGKR
ncbi:MAG TPA: hypothetical protein VET85_02470 [Stellaceae bacterium]|nr:hypothetical protein [Stellaceae bacterium]